MESRQGLQRESATSPVLSASSSAFPVAGPIPFAAPSPAVRSLADLDRGASLGHRFEERTPATGSSKTSTPGPSPGHPLPARVRSRFEQAFGADFSDVRVHRESTLPPSPLRAFARGSHLHFAPTRFQPGTAAGDALIGHELAHVAQQRERRVMSDETADPDSGGGAPFNTDSGLEREASRLGERAARGEAVPVGSQAAKPSPPSAQSAEAPVQAGLFDLLGPANPRLYAPTWLGGHSEEHLEERKWQGRSGPLDLLGPANPRLYLPTRLGGHSEQHLAERRRQRRSGPFDLLGPANPRLYLPTRLGGHSRQHLREREIEGRSGPLDLLGPLNPRQYLPTRLGGHSYDELSRRQRNGTDDGLTALPRSLAGKGLRRLGKSLNRPTLKNLGKRMDYGHLAPERLLKQHPSAFLRRYPISANLENGGLVGNLPSNAREQFFLSQYRHPQTKQTEFTMYRANDPRLEDLNPSRGPLFRAGFLPMRQMASDTDGPDQVQGGGEVTNQDLDQAHESVTMTTQLSGCSITNQRGCLQHLRPHQSGHTLNDTLDPNAHGHTYGKGDYPEDQPTFVMMKRKRNGRTRLYHQQGENPGTFGKQDL